MKKRFISLFFIAVAPFVGSSGRCFLARWLFRASIHRTASLGIAFIDTDRLHMGPRSRIGHMTVLRNLEEVVLEEDARIGTFNWILGARQTTHFIQELERFSRLIIRTGGSITSRHILDCTDTIEVGTFSTIAGFRSQILTHSIDFVRNRQACAPVLIGDYSFLGSGTILLKGTRFPPHSVLSAGSVFSGSGEGDYKIYKGIPAKAVRCLPENTAYMRRKHSRVG